MAADTLSRIARFLAKASWMSLLGAGIAAAVVEVADIKSFEAVGALLYLVGLLCSITALAMTLRCGQDGILRPALAGLGLAFLPMLVFGLLADDNLSGWQPYTQHQTKYRVQAPRRAASDVIPFRFAENGQANIDTYRTDHGEAVLEVMTYTSKSELDDTALAALVRDFTVGMSTVQAQEVGKPGFGMTWEDLKEDTLGITRAFRRGHKVLLVVAQWKKHSSEGRRDAMRLLNGFELL